MAASVGYAVTTEKNSQWVKWVLAVTFFLCLTYVTWRALPHSRNAEMLQNDIQVWSDMAQIDIEGYPEAKYFAAHLPHCIQIEGSKTPHAPSPHKCLREPPDRAIEMVTASVAKKCPGDCELKGKMIISDSAVDCVHPVLGMDKYCPIQASTAMDHAMRPEGFHEGITSNALKTKWKCMMNTRSCFSQTIPMSRRSRPDLPWVPEQWEPQPFTPCLKNKRNDI